MIREKKKTVLSGYLMIVVLAVAQLLLAYIAIKALQSLSFPLAIASFIASIIVLICWAGLFLVHPNEAKVLQLFGK